LTETGSVANTNAQVEFATTQAGQLTIIVSSAYGGVTGGAYTLIIQSKQASNTNSATPQSD
jgi:hypothetical protein